MSSTALRNSASRNFRPALGFLALVPLLLLPSASRAQTNGAAGGGQTQPVDPKAGLPVITSSFNHSSVVSVAGTPFEFNYYDFTITGFTKVGANNSDYDIFSFSNSTLEKQPNVVGVAASYLPSGWTFDDSHDFDISTGLIGIHPDDPQFGLIFIQNLNTTPISPIGAPVSIFHQNGGVDPFTLNGVPLVIPVGSPTPEASTTASFGLLLLLGLGGVLIARRRKGAQ